MPSSTQLAGVAVGGAHPVRLMGVVNVSPESFFKGSVHTAEKDLARAVETMEKEGADFVDVGAMSTAPYLTTRIPEKDEAARLVRAVKIIRNACGLPISIDAHRPGAVEAGLAAGGRILNDITGLAGDSKIARLARQADGVVLMAHPSGLKKRAGGRPITTVSALLTRSVQRALAAGISLNRVAIDPGIGFFRNAGFNWWQWDLDVLQNLPRLQAVACPVLVGISRKSFIGRILEDRDAGRRLAGSLGATICAVLSGAAIVRTHDVEATRDAIRVAEAIQSGAKALPAEGEERRRGKNQRSR